MINNPSEQELRDLLKEGKTLYQISRQFNTTIPEIFKLGKDYDLIYTYQIPYPTKQDLESMYHTECMTRYQIGKEFGVSQGTVYNWLRKYNISTVGRMGAKVPMPPKEVLQRMYIDEGMTQEQIAKEFSVTGMTVSNWLRYYNIQTIVPMPPKEVLERMYHDECMTQYKIAKEFNVSERTVIRWFSYYNIQCIVPMPPKEVIEKMYSEDGMTQEQIAKEFNVTVMTVGNWLRYYNISTVGRMGAKVPMPPKDDLLKCIAEGLNQHQIAEKYNVSDVTIFRWCEHYGIPGMVNGYRCMTDEHRNWRYAVFDRDHRTCQKCGATNTPMQAHHIVPYCDHPEVAYELENGITLCKRCHRYIRGYEYDYIEQFAAITQQRG